MAYQIIASSAIPLGDTELVAVVYDQWLESGELLSGTPTAVEQVTSDLTIANVQRNATTLVIENITRAIDTVVTFLLSDGTVANSPYTIRITVSTTDSRTIVRDDRRSSNRAYVLAR